MTRAETYHDVEHFKFADIVLHWARERLVHELLVARELARGVIRDGLRLQSVDPRWVDAGETFRGHPLVGYCARTGFPPIMIRAEVLEHLLAVAREAAEYRREIFDQEFITRADFQKWLVLTGRPMPAFWYGPDDRYIAQAGSRSS